MPTSTERNLIECIGHLAEVNKKLYDEIAKLRDDLDAERSITPMFNLMYTALVRIAAGNIDASGQTHIAIETLARNK